MRLSEHEVQSITSAVESHLPGAEVFLFGSRVDDNKKGGDIDLLIKTSKCPDRSIKSKIRTTLWQSIGEQKIDIVFDEPEKNNSFIELIKLEAKKI